MNTANKAKYETFLESFHLDGEGEKIDVEENESNDTDGQDNSPLEVEANSLIDKEEGRPEELQDDSLESARCLHPILGKNAFLKNTGIVVKKRKISSVTGKEKWKIKLPDGEKELIFLKELVSSEKESRREIKRPPSAQEKDGDALFWDLVASQLRKLPEILKLQAQHQINTTMFNMQMRMHQQQQQPVSVTGHPLMNRSIQSPVPEYEFGPFQRSF